MRIFIGIALCTLLGFSRAWAFTNLGNGIFQTDGSSADVQGAINASSNGCTVLIPAGSFTWTSGVTNSGKGVRIQGQGSGRCIARSTSSVAVGTGSKTFTLNASGIPSISNGMTLQIERPGTPEVNGSPTKVRTYMIGTVTSYSGTTLVMNITSTAGSGTHPLWIVSTMPSTTIVRQFTTGYLFSLTESAIQSVELTGLRLAWGTGDAGPTYGHILLKSTGGGKPSMVHDCYLECVDSAGVGNTFIYVPGPRGMIWNCSFAAYPFSFNNQIMIVPTAYNAWLTTSSMGTADATGTNNFYIEDCDFHAILNTVDMNDNARAVIRYCTFNNSGIASHGADTSWLGVRHYEIYKNTFIFNGYNDGNTMNLDYFVFLRGGTGVICSNTLPDITSTDYGDKIEIRMVIENLVRNSGPNPKWGDGTTNGAQYHCPRQVGFGRVTGTGTDGLGRSSDVMTYVGDPEPLYIWGNSGTYRAATTDYPTGNPGDATNPDLVANYIKAGRDYFNDGTAKAGWQPYPYPHPLRALAGGGIGNQPPVAVASASPSNGIAPLTVSFSSAGSYDPEGTTLSYSWTFGDGATSTAANPSHTYAANNYVARLSVSDGTNTALSSALNITATSGNRPPVAVASANPTNGVAPLTVNFSSAGSSDPEGTALTYNWIFGDGGTSTAANPSHTYQTAGTYSPQLTVSDGTNTTSSSLLTVTATNSAAGTYTTSFPLGQNPISESGRWINGKTVGLDWANVATTPGLAFGTETGSGGYDDSTALLTGAWGPNQTASARVHVGTRAGGGTFKEVEIRLRSSLSAHSCTGYEINFSMDPGAGAYTQIVRWNGALGSFTLLDSRGGSQYQINEGDEVKAVISGNTITSYIRGQQVLQVTDNTYPTGSPGIGFYLQGTGTNDSGFTFYTVTDGTVRPAPPTNLHIVTGP